MFRELLGSDVQLLGAIKKIYLPVSVKTIILK